MLTKVLCRRTRVSSNAGSQLRAYHGTSMECMWATLNPGIQHALYVSSCGGIQSRHKRSEGLTKKKVVHSMGGGGAREEHGGTNDHRTLTKGSPMMYWETSSRNLKYGLHAIASASNKTAQPFCTSPIIFSANLMSACTTRTGVNAPTHLSDPTCKGFELAHTGACRIERANASTYF